MPANPNATDGLVAVATLPRHPAVTRVGAIMLRVPPIRHAAHLAYQRWAEVIGVPDGPHHYEAIPNTRRQRLLEAYYRAWSRYDDHRAWKADKPA